MWTQDNRKYPEDLALELVIVFLDTFIFNVHAGFTWGVRKSIGFTGGERFLCS